MRLLLACCLLLAALTPAAAETMRGVVIVVIDGDTVLFKPDHYSPASRAFLKIRLADIDAPEKDQAYGDAATQTLTVLLLNQPAEIRTVATDVYGRTIARIQLGTLAVNEELVRRGYAWSSSRNPHHAMRTLQREAQEAQRGLWQDPVPMPPWVWRRAHAAPADAVPGR